MLKKNKNFTGRFNSFLFWHQKFQIIHLLQVQLINDAMINQKQNEFITVPFQ